MATFTGNVRTGSIYLYSAGSTGSLNMSVAGGSPVATNMVWPAINQQGALLNDSSGTLTWQPNSAAAATLGTTVNFNLLISNLVSGSVQISSVPIVINQSTGAITSSLVVNSSSSSGNSGLFQVLRPSSGTPIFNISTVTSSYPSASATITMGDGSVRVVILPAPTDQTNSTPDAVLATGSSLNGATAGVVSKLAFSSTYQAGSLVYRSTTAGTPTYFGPVILSSGDLAVSAGGVSISNGLTVSGGTVNFNGVSSFSLSTVSISSSLVMGALSQILSASGNSQIEVPYSFNLGHTTTINDLILNGSFSSATISVDTIQNKTASSGVAWRGATPVVASFLNTASGNCSLQLNTTTGSLSGAIALDSTNNWFSSSKNWMPASGGLLLGNSASPWSASSVTTMNADVVQNLSVGGLALKGAAVVTATLLNTSSGDTSLVLSTTTNSRTGTITLDSTNNWFTTTKSWMPAVTATQALGGASNQWGSLATKLITDNGTTLVFTSAHYSSGTPSMYFTTPNGSFLLDIASVDSGTGITAHSRLEFFTNGIFITPNSLDTTLGDTWFRGATLIPDRDAAISCGRSDLRWSDVRTAAITTGTATVTGSSATAYAAMTIANTNTTAGATVVQTWTAAASGGGSTANGTITFTNNTATPGAGFVFSQPIVATQSTAGNALPIIITNTNTASGNVGVRAVTNTVANGLNTGDLLFNELTGWSVSPALISTKVTVTSTGFLLQGTPVTYNTTNATYLTVAMPPVRRFYFTVTATTIPASSVVTTVTIPLSGVYSSVHNIVGTVLTPDGGGSIYPMCATSGSGNRAFTVAGSSTSLQVITDSTWTRTTGTCTFRVWFDLA